MTARNAAIDRAKDAFALAANPAWSRWNSARITHDPIKIRAANKYYEANASPAREAYRHTIEALGGDAYDPA